MGRLLKLGTELNEEAAALSTWRVFWRVIALS